MVKQVWKLLFITVMKTVFLTDKDAESTKSLGRENEVVCFVVAEMMKERISLRL
ncbi:hypothetical protein [Segatella copri]|uniref:hypothetical protein n=1 Tax=Segatella copri TaxID=165179 RepID=UPI0015FC39A9|nr:hypothetical protein [Segatella copri]